MSGGVDSSVAALKIKEAGHEAIGVTIKMWPEGDCLRRGNKLCCSLESIQYARSVAEDIGISFHVVDLSEEFSREVTDYFVREYAAGRTPNPCIYCNSRIKFGVLFTEAAKLGAERIATGHYARIIKREDRYFLSEAQDKKKDQTYFLYDISRERLPFIDLPLGDHTKEEVRSIASVAGFTSAERQESQDVCFISEGSDYREFIASKIGSKVFEPGDILNVDGNIIGQHKGIASYTVGQRRGIGFAARDPVYVMKINADENTITVGGREHVMERKIRVGRLNWLIEDYAGKPAEFDVKIRYGSERSRAVFTPDGNGEAELEFNEPQFAPTPGQAAVFYDGEVVAGGGIIIGDG